MSTVRAIQLPRPDYEADDVLVVSDREQLRALANDLRSRLVMLLRERAASTTELAQTVELPKGTVGHHLKVLERAGLVRVVRTRQVRAVTEKFYGRTARLFVIKSEGEEELGQTLGAVSLRRAADEIGRSPRSDASTLALVHARLGPKDARRFVRRLDALVQEFRAAAADEGETYGCVVGLYPTDGAELAEPTRKRSRKRA